MRDYPAKGGLRMRRLVNVLTTCVLIALVALVVAFLGVRLVGLTPYAVLSGSMEPQLPVGSLVYVRAADPATIQPGDAVTFRKDSGSLVTHQAYEVDAESQTILTQGIANKAADGSILHDADPVSFSQVVGVPVLCVPYLGYVNDFVTTPPGVYIVVVVVGVLVLLSFVGGSRNGRRAGGAR